MTGLFSIGYERTELADFLETLRQRKIDTLLDVRELPLSRRKGFSKSALREALTEYGIGYRHERQLGSPKAIRHRLYQDRDYEVFFRDFGEHLEAQWKLLKQLAEELTGNVALMCYEQDFRTCHRSAVIDALSELLGVKPTHLKVDGHGQRQARHAAHSDPGKGLSPA